MLWQDQNLIKVLKEGGVVVMPTDTLYGILGRAKEVGVVERIYKIRTRNPQKPCIILISDTNELQEFMATLSTEQEKEIKNFVGSTSFILDTPSEKFKYLHRGTKTLAFRIPPQLELRNLLRETGPLIAPSANPEGLPPAQNILQAKKYFGELVDLYIDGGEINGKASKVVKLHKDGSVTILRG